jgi:hydrogenase/urease accessory protein HupE
MLSQADNAIVLALPVTGATTANSEAAPTASTFTDFLLLGIEHILTGYDHLLFLFSLLIVTRSFWPALKIITFFTIAHSITLGLAAFNVIDIPSTIVEPLIAATIIYVGVENILRGDHPKGRQWLTFFFGLVHGFGFAAVLREMGISSMETGILLPLFSFNLGVELGQITVAAVFLPIIWWLHKQPLIEPKLTPVCSIFASVAGAYWLIERTLLS